MPNYLYKAIDDAGKIHNGLMQTSNPLELERRLATLKLELISQKEKTSHYGLSRKSVSRQELISFVFHMEQLTRSGVALLEGLTDLRDTLPSGYFKDIIAALVEGIEGGKTFSQTLADHPKVFDNVFVTLIRIGEESGKLPEILRDISENLKWTDEIISHTKKILIYPSVVGIVILAVVTFLMIKLVPQLMPFIKSMGGEIPLYTKALIATSDVFIAYWYIIIPLPFLMVFLIKISARTFPRFRDQLDVYKLKIPVVGELMFHIILARFTNYFALMYSSGITVLDSLEISKKLVNNSSVEKAISTAHAAISDGQKISDAFESTGLFPPLVIRMLRVGETSGNLDESLLNASYFYDREVKESIGKLEPALEPLLTVVMGGIMLWIMVAVLGPVYDTMTQIDI
ncbi:MAG: secretion system protein [Moraxellaceae bacterium]|nr:MAG: secretion system protein [Moraxellaceae bacterium]